MELVASISRKSVKVSAHKRTKPVTKTSEWNRSKMLKLIMPLLGGGNGDDIISGLNDKDPERVKHVMEKISSAVVAKAIDKDKEAKKKVKKTKE